MRDVAAIVEPAVDVRRYERVVTAALIALKDAESKHAASVKREESDRATAKQCRLALGKELYGARVAWDRAPGSFSETWRSFLARVGIEERTGRNYISEYKKEFGITEPSESTNESPEREETDSGEPQTKTSTSKPESFHILIAAGEFREAIKKRIEKWPASSLPAIPTMLRDLADEIEAELSC